jgi:hypothetical protein
MTKLTGAARNFANAPKKGTETVHAGCWKYCDVHIKPEIVAIDANDNQWNFTHRIVVSLSRTINIHVW